MTDTHLIETLIWLVFYFFLQKFEYLYQSSWSLLIGSFRLTTAITGTWVAAYFYVFFMHECVAYIWSNCLVCLFYSHYVVYSVTLCLWSFLHFMVNHFIAHMFWLQLMENVSEKRKYHKSYCPWKQTGKWKHIQPVHQQPRVVHILLSIPYSCICQSFENALLLKLYYIFLFIILSFLSLFFLPFFLLSVFSLCCSRADVLYYV